MGMIGRYLERLAARLRGRRHGSPAVVADASGLRVGDVVIAWNEVRRVQAYKRDAYVGDCLCLAILGAGERAIEITEASPGWDAAGDAIERHLPGAMPHAEWILRLIAGAPGASVAVHPRA
jgi:hypothetical protein